MGRVYVSCRILIIYLCSHSLAKYWPAIKRTTEIGRQPGQPEQRQYRYRGFTLVQQWWKFYLRLVTLHLPLAAEYGAGKESFGENVQRTYTPPHLVRFVQTNKLIVCSVYTRGTASYPA